MLADLRAALVELFVPDTIAELIVLFVYLIALATILFMAGE